MTFPASSEDWTTGRDGEAPPPGSTRVAEVGARTFELSVGPHLAHSLAVVSFKGSEAISRLFHFDVVCHTDIDGAALEALALGRTGVLRLHTANGPRTLHGIVAAIRAEGTQVNGMFTRPRPRYRLRIVPRMWLLKRRTNTKIFQDQSVVDVVAAVLAQVGVPHEWRLAQTYPARGYCVQYQESDYAFVTRLVAEVGILFYFEPPRAEGAAETVVFIDGAEHYASMVGSLPFRPREGFMAGDCVTRFASTRALRSKSIVLREFDFHRPLLDVHAAATLDPYAAHGGNGDIAINPRSLEVYDHHGEYEAPEAQRTNAQRALEQLRAKARVAEGESNCRRLCAGQRFCLEEHTDVELNGDYAITRVDHEGAVPESSDGEGAPAYRNRFEAVPAHVAYRPRRPERRLQQVLESATVAGPPGEEIYTDEFGRIKVQFHWDREGQRNEKSSCWIRTSQPWAGASFGMQFIPRVGSEVLVSFIGGDEDRPVVVGSLYNQTHPAPFTLPFAKTRSGIKTQSTPGGTGANELSFEDSRGNELLMLHAERDLLLRANRQGHTFVGEDQTLVVGKNQSERIDGGRTVTVRGDESRGIGGARTLTVGGDHEVFVGGRSTEGVHGATSTNMNGQTIFNRGSENRTVYGYSSLSVGTEESETGLAIAVRGGEAHQVTKTIALRSDTAIRLEVGESAIVISSDSIHVQSKKVVLHGTDSLTLFGDGPAARLSKQIDLTSNTINLFSKGGVIELDEAAAVVNGPQVLIGVGPSSPPQIEDEAEKRKTKKLEWRMLDENLAPHRNKTYVLVTQGLKKRGTTDGDGLIALDVPEEAFLAEIDLWTGAFPTGPRLHYTVRLGAIPPSTVPAGAAVRLKNLGYYAGEEPDEIAPELEAAIREFQRDHSVEPTGTLDAATTAKLDEVHRA